MELANGILCEYGSTGWPTLTGRRMGERSGCGGYRKSAGIEKTRYLPRPTALARVRDAVEAAAPGKDIERTMGIVTGWLTQGKDSRAVCESCVDVMKLRATAEAQRGPDADSEAQQGDGGAAPPGAVCKEVPKPRTAEDVDRSRRHVMDLLRPNTAASAICQHWKQRHTCQLCKNLDAARTVAETAALMRRWEDVGEVVELTFTKAGPIGISWRQNLGLSRLGHRPDRFFLEVKQYDGAQGKKDVRAGWKVTELQGESTDGWSFWRAWRAAKSRERPLTMQLADPAGARLRRMMPEVFPITVRNALSPLLSFQTSLSKNQTSSNFLRKTLEF